MAHLIDKSALVAEIVKMLQEEYPCDNSEQTTGYHCALYELQDFLNSLEVKEVDLELIIGWFDHIAQIADNRMTLTNQRMTDAHALDEIKCLAKNSSEFITKHYKTMKGE